MVLFFLAASAALLMLALLVPIFVMVGAVVGFLAATQLA